MADDLTLIADMAITFEPFEPQRSNLVCKKVSHMGLWETGLNCVKLHKSKITAYFDLDSIV